MYRQTNKETWTRSLNQGIDLSKIECVITSHVTQYKHGNINDLQIYANEGYEEVPTQETCNFVHQWGKLKHVDGTLELIRDEGRTSISIINQDEVTTYDCDSRQVFKPYRKLEKLVKGTRKLAQRPERESSEYWLQDMTLMVSLFISDELEQLKLLEPYSTRQIAQRLNSAQFKHWYKLVHPDTKYILTKST